MEPVFVKTAPDIDIEDGIVHVRYGDGRECYWKISTFRAFVEAGRFELSIFESAQRGILPFVRKR